MNTVIRIVLMVCFTPAAFANTIPDAAGWTYKQCVDYALNNNISLRKLRLDKETDNATLYESKAQWHPSLNFATTQGFTNYARQQEDTDRNIYAGSYGLNASWTVFNGNARRNQIKADELQLEVSQLGIDDCEYTLQTEILTRYLNILYYQESVGIAQRNLEVSEYQKERAEALMESGKMSRVDYSQIESQYHSDKYSLTSAESSLASSTIELKTLLELGIDADFDIAPADFTDNDITYPLPDKADVYADACAWMPSLQQYRVTGQISDYNIAIAKGGYYPQISLNASVATANNSGGGNFGTQLLDRMNEQISLSVNIPILDNRRNKTAVTKAKIEKLNAELDLESALTTLSQTIENIYIDAVNAQANYESCTEQVKSAKLSDELVNEQFRLGMINTLDLLNAHNTLYAAQLQQLQAKYMAILNIKLLEFYQTSNITL